MDVEMSDITDSIDDPGPKHKDAEKQTESALFVDSSTQCTMRKMLISVDDFIDDPEGLHYYSGLENYQKFKLVLSALGPSVNELNYYQGYRPLLDVEDQFFVALMRLRRYKTAYEIGRFFDISEIHVTNIFVTWVNFMYHIFRELKWWPEQEIVRFYILHARGF